MQNALPCTHSTLNRETQSSGSFAFADLGRERPFSQETSSTTDAYPIQHARIIYTENGDHTSLQRHTRICYVFNMATG